MYESGYGDCSGSRDADQVVGGPLLRAQRGECSAIQELVERHRDDVFGFLLHMTGSETAAAELTGESFLSACVRLKEFRSEAEYARCLHRAAAERALRTSQGGDFKRRETAEYSPTDWSESLPEKAMSKQLRREIEQATNRLPPAEREIFLLKDVAGLSYDEIAEISDRPIGVIKNCLHQARLSLHEAIDRFHRDALG